MLAKVGLSWHGPLTLRSETGSECGVWNGLWLLTCKQNMPLLVDGIEDEKMNDGSEEGKIDDLDWVCMVWWVWMDGRVDGMGG